MIQEKVTTILSYKGFLNFEKIEEILMQFKEEIPLYNIDGVISKRIFSILVEGLENTFKHNALINTKTIHSSVELELLDKPNEIKIRIGNYIRNEHISSFKEKINEVNALNHDELNRFYRESIASTRISEKGGAGLGIIEIARSSRQMLTYEFDKQEGHITFFSLIVTVDKQ